ICDGVHVRYKTLATGKKLKLGGGGGMLKRQRGIQEVHALKGVSFVAHRNESIGVIGTNGSGKSTLMRSITGLTPTSEGTIYAKSRPNLLGVGAALIPDLSGARNIIIGFLALGLTRSQVEEKFDDIVEFTGLEDFIDLPMRTYSSGISQRLKFAIATSVQHEILIVDEALNVGDKKFRDRSEGRIRSIRENADTVFLVSHSKRSIKDTCNRTLWIEKGELRADGPSAAVIKEYQDFNKDTKVRGERQPTCELHGGMHFSRMILQLLRSRRRPPQWLWDSSRLSLKVLPTEIDIFGHVNNGMYFSIMDLGRLDMMVRSGVWKTLQAKGWSGVVSAETISFRKSLRLGHRYHIDTRLIGVDGRTVFFEHRIVVDDEIFARAYVGTRLTAKAGTITREDMIEVFG